MEKDPADMSVSDTLVDALLEGVVATDIIDEAPIFLAPERFDYRLHPLSPGYAEPDRARPYGWRGFEGLD